MTPLFLPADRLDRLAKAVAANPDAVILDLEDGVEPEAKAVARSAILSLDQPSVPVVVRINGADTAWFTDDLAACRSLGWPVAVMLSKAEKPEDLARLDGFEVWALIESALGLSRAREIAAGGAARLAFGSVDYAADLGCAHERPALLAARSELVLASRLAGLAPPLDGVTLDVRDADLAEDDARYAASLGFGGKLCIHPAQISPTRLGLRPSDAQIAWARKVRESATAGGVVRVGTDMIDAPVRAMADHVLARVKPD